MAVSTAQRRPVALAARPALAVQAAAAEAAPVTATRATPAPTTIIAAAVYLNCCPHRLVRVHQHHPHPPTIITAAAARAAIILAPIHHIRVRRASAHSGIALHLHCI